MKKTYLITLILLNTGLAVWLVSRPPVACIPPAPEAPAGPAPVAASLPLPAPNPLPVPTPPPARLNFHWSQVESSDYRIYLENLRAIGCPEATIRDIIVADVHSHYRTLRGRAQRPETAQYWQAGFGLAVLNQTELNRLDNEERAVLSRLLGVGIGSSPAADSAPGTATDLRWCEMLEPKRAALEECWQRFEAAKSAVLAIADQREATEPEIAQLHALEAEQEAALNRLLTPAERAEFELRNSPSARYLRQGLLGVEVAEEEFRVLWQARQEFDTRLATATAGEEAMEAHRVFQAVAAQLLGPERFSRFERSQNPEFQEFFLNGLANGLDDSAIEARWTEAQQLPTLAEES